MISSRRPKAKTDPLFVASVSKFTLNQAVPHLVKLFLDPDEVQNRGPILRLLADLIHATRQSSQKEAGDVDQPVALALYKDEVLGVLTVGLKNPSSSLNALDGLKGMVTTSNLLSDDELGFIAHNVNELFSGDVSELSEDVRSVIPCMPVVPRTDGLHINHKRCYPRSLVLRFCSRTTTRIWNNTSAPLLLTPRDSTTTNR